MSIANTLPLLLAALAQTAPAPTPALVTAEDIQANQRAGLLGRIIYALDESAWVATDAMRKVVPDTSLAGEGGWVVERGADRAMVVTFYRGKSEKARAYFVATVLDGKVTDTRLLAEPLPLTPGQIRLAKAHDAAAAAAVERGYMPCTKQPFNSVVVPASHGTPLIVYLLTAQVDRSVWPAGGHYRFAIDDAGKVLANRRFTQSCLDLREPKLPSGAKPVGVFVNHVLDRTPTEIHVLGSLRMRSPIFVGTPGHRTWQVRGSDIQPIALQR